MWINFLRGVAGRVFGPYSGPYYVDGTPESCSFVVLYFQLYIGHNIDINLIFLCK